MAFKPVSVHNSAENQGSFKPSYYVVDNRTLRQAQSRRQGTPIESQKSQATRYGVLECIPFNA